MADFRRWFQSLHPWAQAGVMLLTVLVTTAITRMVFGGPLNESFLEALPFAVIYALVWAVLSNDDKEQRDDRGGVNEQNTEGDGRRAGL